MSGERLPTANDGGWIGGFGSVGLGVPGPKPTSYRRPDLCADLDHPGITYHPWMDQTWCLCGRRVQPGNQVPVITDSGLTHWWPNELRPLLQNPEPRPAGWRRDVGAYCLVVDRPAAQQLDLFGDAA